MPEEQDEGTPRAFGPAWSFNNDDRITQHTAGALITAYITHAGSQNDGCLAHLMRAACLICMET